MNKRKWIHFYYKKLPFISLWWYRFTMAITRVNHHVSKVKEISDIPSLFSYGGLYMSDPFGGKLDYLAHPTRLERRLDTRVAGGKFGDCDDHAIYWATKIVKSKLAYNVWFAFYTMYDEEQDRYSGHAVCVYEDSMDYFWADYRLPTNCGTATLKNQWEWAELSAFVYGRKPVAALMVKVDKVDANDTPIFGKVETKTWGEDYHGL